MKFRVHFWPTLFSILGLILLLLLGTWQTIRFQEKSAFEAEREARVDLPIVDADGEFLASDEASLRRVRVSGRWNRDHLFLIKHRVYDGVPGFWVINILDLADEPTSVVVNRGWIPFADGEERARELLNELSAEPQSLSGIVHSPDRIIPDAEFRSQLASEQGAPIPHIVSLESYDIVAIEDAVGISGFDLPLVLTLDDTNSTDRFPVASMEHITEPYLTAETHFGYALTWYLLAAALVAIWLASGFGALRSQDYGSADPRQAI